MTQGEAIINLIGEALYSRRLSKSGMTRIQKYCWAAGLSSDECARILDMCEYTEKVREQIGKGYTLGNKR